MDNKIILVRPVITEKTMNLVNLENKYTFQINSAANKVEVAKAVEAKYKVTVINVSIMNTIGKTKRFGKKRIEGRRASLRKAIVTLKAKESITDFNIG